MQIDLSELRDLISKTFNVGELRNLCMDLGIAYDDLPIDATKSDMARELVAYCERRGTVLNLIKRCEKLRPNVAWAISLPLTPSYPSKLILDDEVIDTKQEGLVKLQQNKEGIVQILRRNRLPLVFLFVFLAILILLSLQTYRATKSANETEATLAAVLANLPATRETLRFTETPTPTVASESETNEPLIHAPSSLPEPSSTPSKTLISTSVPTASSSPTSAPTPILVVPTEGESSIIQVTTGLGAKTELEYSMKNTGHVVLDHILSEYRNSTGAEHIVFEVANDVYRILPLRTFLSATKSETANTQIISLINGEEIEGNLVGRVTNSEDEEYDLSTAKEITLVSLSESDSNFEIGDSGSSATWELAMFSPIENSWLVSHPRFSFQYSTFTSTGTYLNHKRTTQAFELEVNQEELLGNLSEIDEIQFGYEGDAIVRVGDNETRGRLFLRTQGGTFTSSHHYRWFLVADLIDGEGAIAFWNGDEQPVASLRKVSE